MENSSSSLWKNLIIRSVVEEDLSSNKFANFLTENFHPDEPMGILVPPDEEFIKITNHKIEKMVRSHMDICLIAVDTATSAIAGMQLQFVWKKEDALFQKSHELTSNSSSPFKLRRFMNSIYAPMNEARYGIFDQFGVSEITWNFLACTGRSYRGIGLGSKLYTVMVELLQEKGHRIVFSIFSSPYSRRCAAKVGFKEITRSYYYMAKDDEGDSMSFVPQADKEQYAAVMVLELHAP